MGSFPEGQQRALSCVSAECSKELSESMLCELEETLSLKMSRGPTSGSTDCVSRRSPHERLWSAGAPDRVRLTLDYKDSYQCKKKYQRVLELNWHDDNKVVFNCSIALPVYSDRGEILAQKHQVEVCLYAQRDGRVSIYSWFGCGSSVWPSRVLIDKPFVWTMKPWGPQAELTSDCNGHTREAFAEFYKAPHTGSTLDEIQDAHSIRSLARNPRLDNAWQIVDSTVFGTR